jgi:chromosome segregation ATPase
MASASPFNFDNIMPGLDFLKQFAAAGGAPGMPQAAQWVTPTLDPKELEKRIQELKSVQFWLDQNAKALSATIQALEVQRMTLETLQGMNVGMADVAAAMTGKTKTEQPVVDPMQWWGAVSQQFQSIATKTMQDMQQHTAASASAKPASAKSAKAKPATAKPRAAAKTGATAKARKTTRRV